MKYILYILIFIFSKPANLIAQDHLTGTRELLMKYWFYRERLKKDFMQLSDPWKRGASAPASIRRFYDNGSSQFIKWGDATIDLGIYLGVLATEYKLLVNVGENTDETIKELYFALRTLDRLDLYAEGAWIRDDPNSYNSPQYMNGFFMRDEIGAGLFDNNNYYTPGSEYSWLENKLKSFGSGIVNKFHSDYISHRILGSGGALEESKDQNVYLMEGLLLVLKSIPDVVLGRQCKLYTLILPAMIAKNGSREPKRVSVFKKHKNEKNYLPHSVIRNCFWTDTK